MQGYAARRLLPVQFFLFFAIIVLYSAGPSSTRAADYLWPVGTYRILTGTFGEFRSSHFHAGIDISTNGINGAPVRAIEDGFVYRLKSMSTGYGRAIYLRLNDGNLAVYGHPPPTSSLPLPRSPAAARPQENGRERTPQSFLLTAAA